MLDLSIDFFYYCVNIFKSFQKTRAISSAGRAGALQALGRRFNPVIAQSLLDLNFKVLYGYFKIYFNNYSDSFTICFFKFYNKIHFKEVNNISFGNCNNNFIYIINLNSIYELYG